MNVYLRKDLRSINTSSLWPVLAGVSVSDAVHGLIILLNSGLTLDVALIWFISLITVFIIGGVMIKQLATTELGTAYIQSIGISVATNITMNLLSWLTKANFGKSQSN